MPSWTELVHNLGVVSILLGGAIGFERELRGKAAGLWTNILSCVGATLFTQPSLLRASGPYRISVEE